jgi:hypothetical protein
MQKQLISLTFILIFSFSLFAQKDTAGDSKKLVGKWMMISGHGGLMRNKDLEMTIERDSLKKHMLQVADSGRDSLIFNSDNTCNVNGQKNYMLDPEKCTLRIPGSNDPNLKYSFVVQGDLLALTNCTLDCITEIYLKIK